MPLKLYAVGDIMLGDNALCNNFGVQQRIRTHGADCVFRDISPLFSDGDIVFGNLECSIAGPVAAHREKSRFYCADPDVVQGLKNAHFNVLSIANNHVMQQGRDLFHSTVRLLRDHGITPVGIANATDTIKIKGRTVAFIAYSFIDDHTTPVCYNKTSSAEKILDEIRATRPNADIVIVSLHWGNEYIPCPSPEQIRIGRDLIDAGADIILGGHPHVTQSYEWYRHRLIIYSLGNFIFATSYIPPTMESFIVQITIPDSPDDMALQILPVTINGDTYTPQLTVSPHKEAFLKQVDQVRSLFENRTLPEYRSAIGDYALLTAAYKRPAKRNMKKQFVRNCYRYSFPTVCRILRQYLGRQRGGEM